MDYTDIRILIAQKPTIQRHIEWQKRRKKNRIQNVPLRVRQNIVPDKTSIKSQGNNKREDTNIWELKLRLIL